MFDIPGIDPTSSGGVEFGPTTNNAFGQRDAVISTRTTDATWRHAAPAATARAVVMTSSGPVGRNTNSG